VISTLANKDATAASGGESGLVMGPVAKWLRRGSTAAAQSEVVTGAKLAVGTGYCHGPDAIEGTIRQWNDSQPNTRDRVVLFRGRGNQPGIDKSDTPVGAIAIWHVRRVSTTAKHYASIVARRTSGLERKVAGKNIWAIGAHVDSRRNHMSRILGRSARSVCLPRGLTSRRRG